MASRGAVAVLLALSVGLAAGLVTWLGVVPGVAVTGLLLVALFLVVQWGGSSGETDVWGFTSSGERTGRYAESGGIAREEQDRALRETRERAEELERD